MEIRTSKQGKILKVVPKGILDSYSAFDLVRFIKSRWEEGDRLVLVVSSSIEYLEEDGISSLLELMNFFEKHGGNIAFSDWNEESSLVLGLFGLSRSAHFFSHEKEAEVWLSSLKIEDRRSRPEQGYDSISSLRQTRPVQFYSAGKQTSSAPLEFIPELSTVPIHGSGSESAKEDPAPSSVAKRLDQSLEQARASAQERILYCESCRARLRIKSLGRHQCPNCGIQFDVSRTGGVRYLEKLLD
ncbi:STAS domain protein [Leptospira langatensis]|uniref:STAS domain protein n=1 Tax=Leptospira langatensis TaxID=2484983 RepID=A0A5F1ZQG6_9LEPT|nr:STAS domain-containing protein [Leptospira langatensis]TGK05387.1 STAS domain protein [Leptospira langatensis]TGL38523.1 STAS domain protein [Leptospira langatensis]